MKRGKVVDKLLYGPEEAASLVGVSRSRIYEMLAARTIPSVLIGRSRRIARADLEAFVERLRAEQARSAESDRPRPDAA